MNLLLYFEVLNNAAPVLISLVWPKSGEASIVLELAREKESFRFSFLGNE
jgi:hypothetical protein